MVELRTGQHTNPHADHTDPGSGWGVNVLAELGQLHLSRPAVDASREAVAAWYEHKARVLELLAAQGSPTAREHAAAAHRHAHQLGVDTWAA